MYRSREAELALLKGMEVKIHPLIAVAFTEFETPLSLVKTRRAEVKNKGSGWCLYFKIANLTSTLWR